MVIGPDVTRVATKKDFLEIQRVLKAAFGREAEAELVRRLRKDGDMLAEFVKPWNGSIAAYAALSRMNTPKNWACLAPVAVLPKYQRGAIAPTPSLKEQFSFGTRLVREIVDLCLHAQLGEEYSLVPRTIVVVGDPKFYGRAGFSSERASNLQSPYSIEKTLLAGPGDDVPMESLAYPAAFEEM